MKNVRFLLVLVALLAFVIPAFAQEEFGLSADDAALFAAANENSAAATSLTYSTDALISLSGTGADNDLTIDVNASGVIGEGAFSMVVTGELTAAGETTPADLEVRVTGDTGYVGLMGQWFSITPDDLTDLSGMAGSMLPVDPTTMMQGGDAGMGDMMGAMADMDPTEFVSMARLDDADGLAHFQTSLDYGVIMQNPGFQQIFMSAFMMGMQSGSTGGAAAMSPEQMQQMGGMMMEQMAPMFENAVFTFDQYVNTDSQLVERSVLTIELPIGAIAAQSDPTMADANLSVVLDITLSGYGEAVSVEAPAESQPLMQLFGAMMGGMQGS